MQLVFISLALFISACVARTPAPTPPPLPTQPPAICANPQQQCASSINTTYQEGCFFSIASKNNVYWFNDPNGKAFWSKGVVNVNLKGIAQDPNGQYATTIQNKYPSTDVWASTQNERLRCWGLNSLGPWSAKPMWNQHVPYTMLLSFSNTWGMLAPNAADFASGAMRFPDIYDPGFEPYVKSMALQMCAPAINDPYLLGYYLDNEIMWGAQNTSASGMILAIYLNYTGIPGNLKAQEFLRNKYKNISALNTAWGISATSWTTVNAFWPYKPYTKTFIDDSYTFTLNTIDYYFNVTTTAVRFQDPNHLILGTKDMGGGHIPPATVLIPTGRWCDVFSLDYYVDLPDPVDMETIRVQTGIPMMVAEMAFRANDTGNGNHNGRINTKVGTQTDRTNAWEEYVKASAAYPFVIGVHWYMWFDQPLDCIVANDCEDSNLGLVNNTDEPYRLLTNRMASVFPTLESMHGDGCATFTPKCPVKRACPGKCNGNGCCDTTLGLCKCDSHHGQLDCSGYIGPFADPLNSINTSRWVISDKATAQSFYFDAKRISTGPNGATIYLNNTGCPASCGSQPYSTTQMNTMQPYRTGTFKASIKTTDDTASGIQINWVTPYNDNTKEGVYLTIVPNANSSTIKVAVWQAGFSVTPVKTYPLGYNPSVGFHNITITKNETNSYQIYLNDSATPLVAVNTNITYGGIFGIGFAPSAGIPSHANTLNIKSVSFVAPSFSKQKCSKNDADDCECGGDDGPSDDSAGGSTSASGFVSSSSTPSSSSFASTTAASTGPSTATTTASTESASSSITTGAPSSQDATTEYHTSSAMLVSVPLMFVLIAAACWL